MYCNQYNFCFSEKGTISEWTLVALLAGRTDAIKRYKIKHPEMADSEINSGLVAYCSDQILKKYFLQLAEIMLKQMQFISRLTVL